MEECIRLHQGEVKKRWIGSKLFAIKQPTKIIFLTNDCRLLIMSKKNVTLQTLNTNLYPPPRRVSCIFDSTQMTWCTQIKFAYIRQLGKRDCWLPLVWCQCKRTQTQTKTIKGCFWWKTICLPNHFDEIFSVKRVI